MRLGPNNFYGQAPGCLHRSFSLIVFPAAARGIFSHSDAKRATDAAKNVAEEHGAFLPFGSPKCGAGSGQDFASRFGLPFDCAQGTKSWSDLVEAGGVEPPSERPCSRKTTCLARSRAA